MANPLSLFPARVRFTNADGTLTPEAYRSLQMLFERVGGSVATGLGDLDVLQLASTGAPELRADMASRLDGLSITPAPAPMPRDEFITPAVELVQVEQLLSEVNALREEVARLTSKINDLEQGKTP